MRKLWQSKQLYNNNYFECSTKDTWKLQVPFSDFRSSFMVSENNLININKRGFLAPV